MPDGILPNEGLADQLGYLLRSPISGVLPWQLMLFTNSIEPTAATTLAELEEATFPGYGRLTMDRPLWTVPDVASGCASSTWTTTPTTWRNGGSVPVTVYGYAMIDIGAGVIRFVQRFDDDDIAPLEPGGELSILPRYTLTSAPCGGSV